jgi:hypothetical protein
MEAKERKRDLESKAEKRRIEKSVALNPDQSEATFVLPMFQRLGKGKATRKKLNMEVLEMCQWTGIPLPRREEKRRKKLLVAWANAHQADFQRFLDRLTHVAVPSGLTAQDEEDLGVDEEWDIGCW